MHIEKYKTLFAALLVVVLISVFISPAFSNGPKGYSEAQREIKNVILLVPDGCSLSVQTIARLYNGGLFLDSMQKGSVSTWAADSVITDSASAATAFATGHKTDDKFISVGPKSIPVLTGFTPTAQPYVPLATVLEGAKSKGMATGLVATSTVSHATPASFAAHTPYRDVETEITKQLVYQDIDVVLGGGFQNLINKTETYTTSFGANWTGARDDIRVTGQNLYKTLLDRGYQFVDSRDGLLSLSSGKVWGLFATGTGMQADINRQYLAPTQPSLAEMTSKAIQLLSKDKDGFFLMVEGSQVDWGDHFCDVAWSVGDFLAFDDAAGVALNFAQKDGNTLVMAFPDHNTGGLTIGNYYQATNKIGHVYTSTTLEDVVNPLKGMKITAAGLTMSKLAGVTDNTAIKAIFKEWWNLDISDADITSMKTGSTISNFTRVGEYIDKTYTVFGWTTAGHTGDDVPLWAYGPINKAPSGHYDNTDLAKIIAEALHFRLPDIQNKLYVKVSDVFKESEWEVDLADPQNPILEISYQGKKVDLPTSKDLLTLSWNDYSKTYLLSSIVVYCPDIKDVYIPREAVNMITSYPQPLTLFGNAAIGIVYDQNDADAQSISYFKCTASGLVTDIRAYLSGTSTGNCIAAIYAVNGGSAGALLEQSNPVSIGTSSSWVNFKLPTPYTVTAGTTYGLAVMGDVPVNLMIVAGAGQRDHNALSSYANGFANPFGPIWGTHDIGAMSIYASGTSNT